MKHSLFLFILTGSLIGAGPVWAQQTVKDFRFSKSNEDGSQGWEIKGQQALINGTQVNIDSMDAKYYQSQDTVSVKSNQATLNQENMDVYLEDDVRIENSQGAKLNTESLSWQKKDNLVKTDDWVKADNNSMAVTAKGMTADTVLKKVDFNSNVEVKVPDAKSGLFTTIICNGPLEIEYDKGVAVFNGDVALEYDDGKLFCDKATLYMDIQTKRVSKVVAEGNVKIEKGENITYAEKATYLDQGRRVILEGRPKVIYFPENSGLKGN